MANILVVGPHPDDQELGMGGTIARLAAQGHDVLLLDMTNGEPTPHGTPEKRAIEAEAAREILSRPAIEAGHHGIRRVCLGLPNRFVEHTIEARHAVAGVIRAHQSDLIFVPYPEDAHPDHRAVTRIVEDARFDAKLTRIDMPGAPPMTGGPDTSETAGEIGPPKYAKWLFYYYATHLRWVANPRFVFDISGFTQLKIESIKAYHTQFVLPEKNRKVVDWVDAAATYFGSRIGTEAGEPFHTKEPVGLSGLAELV